MLGMLRLACSQAFAALAFGRAARLSLTSLNFLLAHQFVRQQFLAWSGAFPLQAAKVRTFSTLNRALRHLDD